jgi:hypothetical protein
MEQLIIHTYVCEFYSHIDVQKIQSRCGWTEISDPDKNIKMDYMDDWRMPKYVFLATKAQGTQHPG